MKFFLQYFVLVVISIAIIFGILHLGERLTPPPDIHGQWELNGNSLIKCSTSNQWEKPARMDISQSGLYLDILIGGKQGLELPARFSNNEIHAEGSTSMKLTLETKSKPYHLSGKIQLAGCETPIDVEYIHQPQTTTFTGDLH